MQIAERPDVNVIYPSFDGEPVAETYDHLYAILVTLEVLQQYLLGQRATVLVNQFLYYSQGFPRLRVAPDVMVVFGVEPEGRDSYKIWEESEVPSVVFEMTSKGTQQEDQLHKYRLYAQLGVQEYWLFDPKGEWLESPLMGYCLNNNNEYEPIQDLTSQVLGLQLTVEEKLISFTEVESRRRLPMPAELSQELELERQKSERLRAQLKALGVEPVE